MERHRTDPQTDLHLWTFWRKNPFADGGALPLDEPEWPGPLKEVRCNLCVIATALCTFLIKYLELTFDAEFPVLFAMPCVLLVGILDWYHT